MNNTVELLGYYGSDEVIACSAWTSTSRDLNEKKRKRIPKLIDMLWSNGHETPFEKGTVHFLIDCDIASHIHLLKHRLASINAESARYKELKEDKTFIPDDWPDDWKIQLEVYTAAGNTLYHEAIQALVDLRNQMAQLDLDDEFGVDVSDYIVEEQEIITPPLPPQPQPVIQNPQMTQQNNPQTNLTRTQEALLSPMEKVIASKRKI